MDWPGSTPRRWKVASTSILGERTDSASLNGFASDLSDPRGTLVEDSFDGRKSSLMRSVSVCSLSAGVAVRMELGVTLLEANLSAIGRDIGGS